VTSSDVAGSPFTIRSATAAESAAVRELLRESELPLDGVPDDLADFLVAMRGEELVGTIGLERHGSEGTAALLRSAAVRQTERGTGIGEALVHALLERARAERITSLVLLTTTAERWFPRFGFERITRDDVPAALHASREFQGACPASAVVMRLAM
jgi:amino-acid N-acetyltransferase